MEHLDFLGHFHHPWLMDSSFSETPPDERLDNLIFHPKNQSEGSINVGDYTCDACARKVHFTTNDFLKAFGNSKTRLSTQEHEAACRRRPLRKDKGEAFLDFHCPGCRRPVRLVFEPTEFAMGCYYFTVVALLEGQSPRS
ncbi:MAG: hypothetical protein HY549_05210 [Elusimicrobia bacterium]|nr:hypothetical protein [Elusimicrobiota bacterium]